LRGQKKYVLSIRTILQQEGWKNQQRKQSKQEQLFFSLYTLIFPLCNKGIIRNSDKEVTQPEGQKKGVSEKNSLKRLNIMG
jgi:hypothetical protein